MNEPLTWWYYVDYMIIIGEQILSIFFKNMNETLQSTLKIQQTNKLPFLYILLTKKHLKF